MIRKAGISPFVCMHKKHVAGTVLKLVHTKRILINIQDTVCKAEKNEAIFYPAS